MSTTTIVTGTCINCRRWVHTTAAGWVHTGADARSCGEDTETWAQPDPWTVKQQARQPRRPRRGPRYRELVEYIALNDEPTVMDPEEMEGFISTQTAMVATHIPAATFAKDILALRERLVREGVL